MTKDQLVAQIKLKKSFLCVGLDTDLRKVPTQYLHFDDPIFAFNRDVIEATKDFAVAYKPNLAFYEKFGSRGWRSLEKTMEIIPPDIFTIADAKRGDIGNTARMYAETFFEELNFDAVTVNPLMGRDSVEPYLDFQDKWTIILGLTSNSGATDFQTLKLESGVLNYEQIMITSSQWGNSNNTMFVVGATRPDQLAEIRKSFPEHFFLVPGVGAQGGTVEEVSRIGMNADVGLLINSSRGILYAGKGEEAMVKVCESARLLQQNMEMELFGHN
ncbi:MAG TPA: orotidine-5'-phosphate decarboxylase [Flavobacteriales bacterium]|jgi:orotidine-5'-phosphate decarboxylase|nr:orotidine-5'-phosphate decarboxylase [Flavobacteriales bacterium]